MSLTDDDKLKGRPTRTGSATGHSNERTMLSNAINVGSFLTKFKTMGDGTEVMMRTKGGMPQFSTKVPELQQVQACTLQMDSGMVDLMGVGDADPLQVAFGRVYQTSYVSAHTATAAGGKAIGCGKIDSTTAKGPVVANGADSIAYMVDTKAAMGYIEKKKLAWHIYPSMFTGRMRLYVQSLFGSNWQSLKLSDGSSGIGRPMLTVTTKEREEAYLPAVNIGSGCGLFLDPVTKLHFVIEPTDTAVYVYPLQCTPCAARFRKLLSSTTLSEADKERVEAYILSRSIPMAELAQILTIDSTPSEAMGYSWHFNWDGDKCDIVDVLEVNKSGVWYFRSTHYRLTFTCTNLNFTVSRAVVSGPEDWTVAKHGNPIAYPDWFYGRLQKAGDTPSGFTSATEHGKVYCFYKKNELKLVEYNGSPSTHARYHQSDPPQFGGDYYTSTVMGWLIDGTSGSCERRESYTGYSRTFECDGVVVGGDAGSFTGTRWEATTGSRVKGAQQAWYSSGTVGTDYGEPTYTWSADGGGTYSVSYTYPNYALSLSTNPLIWYKWSQPATASIDTFTEATGSNSLVVIPFLDAEAVYLYGSTNGYRSGTTISYSGSRGDGNIWWLWFDTQGHGEGQTIRAWDIFYSGLSKGSSASSSSSWSNTQDVQLVNAHGSFSTSVTPDLSSFFAATDSVSQRWATISSANGVVHSSELGVESGSPIYPSYSSIVGWA